MGNEHSNSMYVNNQIPINQAKFFKGRHFIVPSGYEQPGGSVSPNLGDEFLSVPKKEIPDLVKKYIDAMEIGTTEEWCQCKWHIHPDDTEIKSGHCRNCNHPNKTHKTQTDQYSNTIYPCTNEDQNGDWIDFCPCQNYQGRRQRRIDDEPLCPVHNKLGLILGFYEWLFPVDGKPGIKTNTVTVAEVIERKKEEIKPLMSDDNG